MDTAICLIIWNAAEDFCISIGGHLASIHSKAEQDFISKLAGATTTYVWYGATDIATEVNTAWDIILKSTS